MASNRRTARNVLSIDGCGFRGRMQLLVLDELMKQHSGNIEQPSRPCDVFDLICGTATGGLIAILLGRLGITCGEAIEAYNDLERRIFDATPTIQDILARREPFNTAGFRARLEEIIQQHAGNSNAPMFARETDRPARKCRTFVTVVSGSTAYDADPYRIRSYTSTDVSPTEREWTILDAALGTKSCPIHFSPYKVEGNTFMAANMSGFSNPSMIAYLEALDIFGRDAELSLVSLGMGLRDTRDYAQLSREDVQQMIENLNLQITDPETLQKLERLISHTHLVAIGTQIKHLRLQVLIDQNPKQKYMRLDPDRDDEVFILVDYTQKELIETAKNRFLQERLEDMISAVDFIQRVDSKWIELRGYTCDGGSTVQPLPQADMSEMTARQVMRECLSWEDVNSGKRISCFVIRNAGASNEADSEASERVTMFTGKISTDPDEDSTLYVRVLLDDEWRFFLRRSILKTNWITDKKVGAKDPIDAIQYAFALGNIRDIKAFRSDGWYTTSDVKPGDANVYELSFSYPYHGTWVRTSTA